MIKIIKRFSESFEGKNISYNKDSIYFKYLTLDEAVSSFKEYSDCLESDIESEGNNNHIKSIQEAFQGNIGNIISLNESFMGNIKEFFKKIKEFFIGMINKIKEFIQEKIGNKIKILKPKVEDLKPDDIVKVNMKFAPGEKFLKDPIKYFNGFPSINLLKGFPHGLNQYVNSIVDMDMEGFLQKENEYLQEVKNIEDRSWVNKEVKVSDIQDFISYSKDILKYSLIKDVGETVISSINEIIKHMEESERESSKKDLSDSNDKNMKAIRERDPGFTIKIGNNESENTKKYREAIKRMKDLSKAISVAMKDTILMVNNVLGVFNKALGNQANEENDS